MAILDPLPAPPIDGGIVWFGRLLQMWKICFASQHSGTTAQRPTEQLYTGRTYFDTTLGKPIWYKTAGWVDATGASV